MTKYTIKTIFRQRTNFRMILPFAVLFVVVSCLNGKTTEYSKQKKDSLKNQKAKKISKSDEVFLFGDKQPQFVGGDSARQKYINDNLFYPIIAEKKSKIGEVIVHFVVEKDGSISNIQLVHSVNPRFDKAVLELIKGMPDWIPGEKNGEIVRVNSSMSFSFNLPELRNKRDVGIQDKKESVFTMVELYPEYPGGNFERTKFIDENIKYPAITTRNNIQGRVICNFIVETDGNISEVNVVKGIHPLLDIEAVRVIESMPNWIPGKYRGKVVRVRFTLPISFRIPNINNEKISENDVIYENVDKQPEFPGGDKARLNYIEDKIFPKNDWVSHEQRIHGRVVLSFVVEKDGSITDVLIERGVDGLDKGAVDIIKGMPNWIPGERNGEIVRVRYTLPITFRLQR